MLNPFAQLYQHCWGHARALCLAYKVYCLFPSHDAYNSQHCWGFLLSFACSSVKNDCLLKLYRRIYIHFLILVGARVFARRKDNLYYRGFVKKQIHYGEKLYIDVELDHLGPISHQDSDERAIILDIIPSYSHVHATQRVIGHFPGYASYIPGVVVRRNEDCWQGAYHVKFDTGEERQLDFNEIRILPPYVQLVF